MSDDDPAARNLTPPPRAVRHPFFEPLTAAELEAVTRGLPQVAFAPGTVFAHEGEPGDCAYIVTAGTVEIVKARATEDERSFGMRGPGDLLGEMSLLDLGEPRSASMCAVSAVEALVISRHDFEALLTRFPQLSRQLLRTLSHRLRSSENATLRDLQEKNSQLHQAYLELKAAQQQLVKQAVLARELAHAQRIQLRMLPASLPRLPGVDAGAAIHAARSVGGDLYDMLDLGGGRLAFAVGDVSGKGMPAALYMALVSSLLRAEASQGATPETVVRRINAHLCDRDLDDMFVTLLYCELDLPARRLQVVRAGHERPLLWSGRHAVALDSATPAMALGLVADPRLEVQQFVLPAAATLVVYTDGVTDAIDEQERPFGKERLMETVTRHLDLPAQALCDALAGAVLAYHGVMPQYDDVAVMALHVA